MSGLITNTASIESQEGIKNTIRKVSFNPSCFRQSASLPRLSQQVEKQQDLVLKSLFRKINEEERANIRNMAHEEARLQLSQLKGKLRKNAGR